MLLVRSIGYTVEVDTCVHRELVSTYNVDSTYDDKCEILLFHLKKNER